VSAGVNAKGHLTIGGCDVVDLAQRFGTPLWIMDEATIRAAANACVEGLKGYPEFRVIYAGKAFLCTAMCRLVDQLNLGLDVVSEGELHTAISSKFPADRIYMHGNNKSQLEIDAALKYGVNIIIDNMNEAHMVQQRAHGLSTKAHVLVRVTPGVEPDTHAHIKTGQHDSKFGFLLEQVPEVVHWIAQYPTTMKLLGLHAHIGSQSLDLEPYLQIVDILGDLIAKLTKQSNIEILQLDLGGGLGITYNENDSPVPIFEWARAISDRVKKVFTQNGLSLPLLMLEPGRSIVGTAGITLYRAGHPKTMGNQTNYLALDGGMADNPRPITYQARYTACVANRMNAEVTSKPITLAGRYCESGDIIIREAYLPAESGDLIAIFGTGAYNYSMASNYNRTPRPACILVCDGNADIIIERETIEDLVRQDRIPQRLMDESG
jgi:diaminopimelate decarboxylase